MHDYVMDAPDDALALQSNPARRADHARGQELQFMQTISRDFPSSLERMPTSHPLPRNPATPGNPIGSTLSLDDSRGAGPSDDAPSAGPASLIEHWRDRVRMLPEMRSALIALDERVEGSGWSYAFSLCKADLEPWLSYYSGYKKSQLFAAQAAGQRAPLQLQYEVQAILELKSWDKKLILEPPVQINRPVEYLDLISELNTCRNPQQAQEMAKIANEAHDRLLAEAMEKGREMGDRLYHALLGPDFINLSMQWQKLYQRKPSVEELCCMLTTGRIKIIPAKRPVTPRPPLRQQKNTVQRAPVHQEKPQPAPVVMAEPEQTPDVIVNIRQPEGAVARPQQYNAGATNRKTAQIAQKLADETRKRSRLRRILRYLCQVSICCAALAAHAFAS